MFAAAMPFRHRRSEKSHADGLQLRDAVLQHRVAEIGDAVLDGVVEPLSLAQVRDQGIGERLFRSVVGQLAATNSGLGLHLWVFEANVAGLRFYERLGGRVVGKDSSRIPAAGGKAVLLVHWPTIAHIG